MNSNQSNIILKPHASILHYTTGIETALYNESYEMDYIITATPLPATLIKLLEIDINKVHKQMIDANIVGTFNYISLLDFHYFIHAFLSEDDHFQGLLVLGPMKSHQRKQENDLAFMSRNNLSIEDYNQFKSFEGSLPTLMPIQTQYYKQLIDLVCTKTYYADQAPILEDARPVNYNMPVEPITTHHPFALEKQLGQLIFSEDQAGLEVIAEAFSQYPKPILAPNDPLRSAKNFFISTVNSYVRFAIEAGLNSEIAFTYCDHCINQCELCRSINQVDNLTTEMIVTLKTLVKEHDRANYSSPVALTKAYIDNNIAEALTLSQVAKATGYSPKYLSEVFVKETGVTFKTYLNEKKLEMAKSLLLNTSNTILDVCTYLGYCNQSYFTKIFKSYTGFSPSKFIKQHKE